MAERPRKRSSNKPPPIPKKPKRGAPTSAAAKVPALKPPPPPGAKASVSVPSFKKGKPSKATAAAKVSAESEVEEDTVTGIGSGAVPELSRDDEALLSRLKAEEKALSQDVSKVQQVATLRIQQALLIRDMHGDLERVLELCEKSRKHPLVTYLLCSIAQGATTQLEFEQISTHLEEHGSRSGDAEKAEIQAILADAWLYRFGAADRASDLAGHAMATFQKLGSVDTHDLNSIFALSLARLENWAELEAFHSASSELSNVALAAQVAYDQIGDEERTLEHLARLHKSTDELGCYSSNLELLLLLVSKNDVEDHRVLQAVERRIVQLERSASGGVEVSATQFIEAQLHETLGDSNAALTIFDDLSARLGWSPALAHLGALRTAMKGENWQAVAAHLASLATLARQKPLRISYNRRRAEVLEHCAKDPELAFEAWQRLFEVIPLDVAVRRSLQLLKMDQPKALFDVLVRLSTTQGSDPVPALRRAVAVAESRNDDLVQAADLARLCADSSKQSMDLHVLVRIRARQNELTSVSAIYSEIASMEADEYVAAALLFIAGVHAVRAGRDAFALEHLNEAIKRSPSDLASQLLMASIHRNSGDKTALKKSLGVLIAMSASEQTKFQLLCELGSVCGALKDPSAAQTAIAQARELRPGDVELLLTLADLHVSSSEWDKAADLWKEAGPMIANGTKAATVFMKLGALEENERSNKAAALRAYERARELDPENVDALHCCQSLYSNGEHPAKQLQLLREELGVIDDPERRLAVLLEVAQIASLVDEPVKLILEAYTEVLEIDADNAEALEGLLTLARSSSENELIVKVFSAARESLENAKIVFQAQRTLEDWKGFVIAGEAYIDLADSEEEKAKIAAELAGVYESKLAEVDKAVAAHQKVILFAADKRSSQQALRRLFTDSKQWREFVDATEDELKTIKKEDSSKEQRIGLLLEIADVRRNKLKRESEAALAYESVLELDKGNEQALGQLEKLYASLGRDKELLRVKQALSKAGNTTLSQEIAELQVRTGDIGGAVISYQEALSRNPSDREVFTTFEKLCYSNEQWEAVMTLYNSVIESVEQGSSKAYRLGDLYSRRGQVQLKYIKDASLAIASFLNVLEVDPSNNKAMETLDRIYGERKNWKDLIAAYEHRAELVRDTELKVESLRKAAEIARSKSGDRAETARLYQSLADLNPEDAKANENLEEYYTESENWSQLIKILESRLERLDDEKPDLRLLQRLAKLAEEKLRDEKRAIRYYQKITTLAPQNRRALDALARIFESTERWTEFVEVTRRLVKVTTDRSVKALLYFKCGSVTEAKFGNEEDAIRYYDAAIKTSPSCLPAVHGLRDCYLRRKDWPRVIQTLELEAKLWQDDKERAGVFSQVGRIYGEELKQSERALHYYELALSVDPECAPANRALFEHYFEHGQWDQAHPLSQALAPKALRDGDPMRRSEFYRKRGIVAQHTGDPLGAAESILVALEIKPENLHAVEALTQLAEVSPDVYDFASVFEELEKIYRKQGDTDALLAQLMVGQARVQTSAGNLQAAESLLRDAVGKRPGELRIVSSLVELYSSMRNWAAAIGVLEAFITPDISQELQIEALMQQATIYSDGQMDARKATETFERIIGIDDTNPEVFYLLSQELFSLERYEEAKTAIGRVIELSAVPGVNFSAERLARYYYYLGRIHQRGGDQRSATSQYRRAAEYDPGYAPPALALAMRSMRAGDQHAAETRLLNSAHAAMSKGDSRSAVSLQRGLARVLLRGGDREAAIEAYRGILEVEPDGAADRLSLAEIYADVDLTRAIEEVWKVIDTDFRHGPAYRVLASYYMQAGQPSRALRVLSTMELLGASEKKDREMAANAGERASPMVLTEVLTSDLRMTLMANDALSSVVGEFFTLCSAEISQFYPRASLGTDLVPLPKVEDSRLNDVVGAMSELFGLEPEVYVAQNVPGRVIAIGHPRTIIVLDQVVLGQSQEELTFAVAWALEGICGSYAPILQLGEKQRKELSGLMRSLFMPEASRSVPINEFVQRLPEAALEILRRHEGEFQDFDMEGWIDGMNASARRAGLLACDDLGASARLLALLSGETIDDYSGGLGKVFCGEDLFHFQMSDQYQQLRTVLSANSGNV